MRQRRVSLSSPFEEMGRIDLFTRRRDEKMLCGLCANPIISRRDRKVRRAFQISRCHSAVTATAGDPALAMADHIDRAIDKYEKSGPAGLSSVD